MTDRRPQYGATLLISFPLLLALLVILGGCTAADGAPADEAPPFVDHPVAADFEIGSASGGKADETEASFDRHDIISEAFFLDTNSVTAEEVQAFLEDSPYDGRSWLADERVAGRLASFHLVEAARNHGINPVLLLARLQVEQTLISKSSRPSQYRVDRAMGCGCYDGQECFERYLGLANQFECAAGTIRDRYDDSVDGTGGWRRGKTRLSLDGLAVTPKTHATASMYAYTPWVLVGRGGNWLVWNITRRFMLHLVDQGAIEEPAWIGTPCDDDDDCEFTGGGAFGFCYDFQDISGRRRGVCTLPCEGGCPDRQGEPLTFCIPADVPEMGICVTTPDDDNEQCAEIPGTTACEKSRFVGDSSFREDSRMVCAPDIG